MKRCLAIAFVVLAFASTGESSIAKSAKDSAKDSIDSSGTPEQRAACRPDVRRFCHTVKPEDGSSAYLNCLSEHREKLTEKCRAVLNGQL